MSKSWPDCSFVIKKGDKQNIEVGKALKVASCVTDETSEIIVKAIYDIRFLDNGNIIISLDVKQNNKKGGK